MISAIEWKTTPWMRSTLLHDRAIKLSKAKVQVYSDSVLCLGKIHEHLASTQKWTEQVGWFMDSKDCQELNGIDGEPVEFEWNVSQDTQHWICSIEIRRKMAQNGIKPEEFEDRIIFMSMYNDIDWSQDEENFKKCVSNSTEVQACAHRFPKGHWSFLGPETEEKWYGTHTYKPEGQWNRSADMMMLTLRESGHPVFRATSALDRGFLESNKGGTLFIHYNGDLSNADLLFSTIISVNQLSVCGALADWCGELAQQISVHAFSSTRNLVAQMNERFDCELSPEVLSVITKPLEIDVPAQGNLLRSQSERFQNLPEGIKVIQMS